MTEVDARRTAATARALLEAVAPQDIVRTLRTADSGQRRAVAPAIARVVGSRNWQQRLAQRLAGDVKYAVWRAVARGEREAALRDAEEAVRKAPRNERARQEAALAKMRGQDYAGKVERTQRELEERGDPGEMADEQADLMLEEVVRHATTILDSAYSAADREQQRRGEMAATVMATEWFVTVHGAHRRATDEASARVVEEVLSVVLVGVSRQATDHIHEVAFFEFPVSGTAVRSWTAERYMVRPRDVNAQPARNTGAAVRYVQRQSTEMLAVTYEDRETPAGRYTPAATWRQAVTRRWSGRIPAARGVRTYPLTGFEVYARPGGRYGEGGRYAEDEVSYTPRLDERTLAVHGRMSEAARRRMRAQLAPAALVYHPNAAVPASSYTVEDEALGVGTAFFFARDGTDAAAVEMERDTALTVHSGAAPKAMPVYTAREGAGLTDTPRPGEDTARAVEMLRKQAEVVAAMARGVRPPQRHEGQIRQAGQAGTGSTRGQRGGGQTREGGESVVGQATVRDMQQQAETDMLRRAAREEIERRERELDVRVRTDGAPQYLRTEERQQRRDTRGEAGDRGDRGATGETGGTGGTGGREVNMLYDERSMFEEDATETFGVAGIFYMIGSEATRYEGQPVVVVDADQALRHERHAQEMRAVRHIYRGSREHREQALQRLRQHSTPVSISNYPVV